jgi:excisionase family DNA binding protein
MRDVDGPRVPSTGPVKYLVTVQEAADALGIDGNTLYLLLLRGEVRSIKIGRARRIPITVLEELMAPEVRPLL